MATRGRTRIELCGRIAVELAGRRIEQELPGRQGKLVFAYLVLSRDRPTARDELIDLLWPGRAPADPDESLSALLSKLRRALGHGTLEGRRELTLRLPADAWIDLEAAVEAAERAEAAAADADWTIAWEAGHVALRTAELGFFARHDHPWVQERRRELEELRLRALECIAEAGVALGGPERAAGERAARTLVQISPYRETGHVLLMKALAAGDNLAEALQAYDALRVLLRDELGAAPGAASQTLHERLLSGGMSEESKADLVAEAPAGQEVPGEEPSHGDLVREERKVVTVVFIELAAAPEPADPERLRAALAGYESALRDELERFGGAVQRLVGGVSVAVFGAPRAHEDDPERAVAAALRACALVQEINRESAALAFTARAGVATGEAIVTSAAGPTAGEDVVTGEVLTMARRLRESAPAGEVLVDESTYKATSARAEYEEREPVAAESRTEPASVWALRSILREPALPPRRELLTDFIGRANELSLLSGLYRSTVEARRPRAVLVLGQAGVGKSRLIEEFVAGTRAGAAAPAVYRGRCLPFGEGITYWALREILWEAAGISFDDTSAVAIEKLEHLVRALPGELDFERTVDALAIGSGISLPESRLEGTSPESIAEELGLAWPLLLSGLAADRPAVVVVEDLHWAEAPLLEMLHRIVSRSSGSLFVVATARPEIAEIDPGWSSKAGVSQIALEPLTEAQSREFVHSLLPAAEAELRETVVSTAEGNPFFTEEIVSHLIDRGVLRADGKGLTANADSGAVAIPSTVRAVLSARIDALTEDDKRTIQDAAVVGRIFWATTLEAMRTGRSTRSSLASLEQKGLVATRPASSLPDLTELSFRHGLIREVAYASIPRGPRCRAHAGVARWLEELAGDRRGEFVDLLAHHFEAAAAPADVELAWPADSPEREEIRSKAVGALLEAGRAARQRYQIDQALGYASRAAALATADEERLAAVELKAGALHAAIRADEAFSTYHEGIALARAIGDAQAASRLRAEAVLLCARYAGAFARDDWKAPAAKLVEEGLKEAGEDAVSFETGALLLGRLSIPRWFARPASDPQSAQRDARRAVDIAEKLDSPYLLAAGLEATYRLVIQQGLCRCGEIGERMLAAAGKVRDRADAHEGLVMAGMSFFWAGRFDIARQVAHRAMTEAQGLSPHRRLHAAAIQTVCLVAEGRIDDLLETTGDTADLVAEEGGRTCPYGSLALAGWALSLFETDQTDDAASAVELLRRVPPTGRASSFLYRGAEILRPFTGPEATRRTLDRMEGGMLDAVARIHKLRIELQLRALSAEPDGLDGLVDEARRIARPKCSPPLAWIADWAEAVTLARSGRSAEALALASAAASGLERYGEPYTAARLLVDLLAFLDPGSGARVGEDVGERLEAMGALASAGQAQRAAPR